MTISILDLVWICQAHTRVTKYIKEHNIEISEDEIMNCIFYNLKNRNESNKSNKI